MTEKADLGVFESACDVGTVNYPGSSVYEPLTGQYRLKGSGSNMWFAKDEFHFLWKRLTGNFIIDTQVQWIGEGTHPHRKAGITIRETLESGSRHVSAEYHGGDGLMSLQYRLKPDSLTLEQSSTHKHL